MANITDHIEKTLRGTLKPFLDGDGKPHITGFDQASQKIAELIGEANNKAELFDWLMSRMRCFALQYDNKARWELPVSISNRRAESPLKAIALAYVEEGEARRQLWKKLFEQEEESENAQNGQTDSATNDGNFDHADQPDSGGRSAS